MIGPRRSLLSQKVHPAGEGREGRRPGPVWLAPRKKVDRNEPYRRYGRPRTDSLTRHAALTSHIRAHSLPHSRRCPMYKRASSPGISMETAGGCRAPCGWGKGRERLRARGACICCGQSVDVKLLQRVQPPPATRCFVPKGRQDVAADEQHRRCRYTRLTASGEQERREAGGQRPFSPFV